jgi:hypothetical protein
MKWFDKCPRCGLTAELRRICNCGYPDFETAPGKTGAVPVPSPEPPPAESPSPSVHQPLDTYEFCNRLRARLFPQLYQGGVIENPAPFELLLTHGNWLTGRYAFAVLLWSALGDKRDVLSAARSGLSRHHFTIPFLAQVGLYVVVCGPEAEWGPVTPHVRADQTGLHSVIVQGVHFVDLETRASSVSRSQWGPIRFGGTTAVTDIVTDALG